MILTKLELISEWLFNNNYWPIGKNDYGGAYILKYLAISFSNG
ncbi:protein of unknown function [Candidatus Nitrosocosmicus franklandus]|uniref:Uncharacterized protein n=1 Tax=Candidatus Nitrosocosmicus franklandianus TaxID=1798806 RepID=A0A484I6I4_9ARCH|nr:protein of unknown function [Candidatus Nitrosocosmicus franklandus]